MRLIGGGLISPAVGVIAGSCRGGGEGRNGGTAVVIAICIVTIIVVAVIDKRTGIATW